MLPESSLQFFLTVEHECPYLDGKTATNAVVDPSYQMNRNVYSNLATSGFRRTGRQVYRPHCASCSECVATRIPVNEFALSRSQRRTWKRNQDLTVRESREFLPEYGELYSKYIYSRHSDGDVDAEEVESFADFLQADWCDTLFVEYWKGEELLAVAVVDELNDGLSSVYTFFEPIDGSNRGLGTYAVLWQVEKAKSMGLNYIYPGYWIKDCQKMNYKTRFQPIEGLMQGEWVRLEK